MHPCCYKAGMKNPIDRPCVRAERRRVSRLAAVSGQSAVRRQSEQQDVAALMHKQVHHGEGTSSEVGIDQRGAPEEERRRSIEVGTRLETCWCAEHDHSKQPSNLVAPDRVGPPQDIEASLYVLLAEGRNCSVGSPGPEGAFAIGIEQELKMVPPRVRQGGVSKNHHAFFGRKRRGLKHGIEDLCYVAAGVLGKFGDELGVEAKHPWRDRGGPEPSFQSDQSGLSARIERSQFPKIVQRVGQPDAQRPVDAIDPGSRGNETPSRSFVGSKACGYRRKGRQLNLQARELRIADRSKLGLAPTSATQAYQRSKAACQFITSTPTFAPSLASIVSS